MGERSWLEDASRRLRAHFASERSVTLYAALTSHLLDAATGGVIFLAGVSAAQVAQQALHIGSATPFLPRAIGAAAVGCSSAAALHFASIPREIYGEFAVQSRKPAGEWHWPQLLGGSTAASPSTASRIRLKVTQRWEDLADAPYPVYMLMGLLCFKLLGGRMNALAPSPFSNLGAFHLKKASLPATADYATTVERGIIQEFGRLYGCHTCGVKQGVRYHADHMPPKLYVLGSCGALVAKRTDERFLRRFTGRKTSFRFYPQCEPCSNQQGSVVKQWKATRRMHLLSLRAYHATGLWLVLLCTGGLYVGGSNFHETSEVAATTSTTDDSGDTAGAFTSSDFALLLSLRERERKLRRERGRVNDTAQVAAIDKQLDAVSECKAAVKADIKRQNAK
ncbi:hypothetical protein BBJ28_00006871 [Nothophytophthora sp. Chile5]|nr:hypothetical protein BBJ28_00006871 [Nothophytophthora sp. Chile5]